MIAGYWPSAGTPRGRWTTTGEQWPGTPGTPRRSEALGSGTVESRRHVVTMREPQPVALQPGGIPCPSSGQTPRGLPGPLSYRGCEDRSRCPRTTGSPGNEPSTGRNLSARRPASTGSSRSEHPLEDGYHRYPGSPHQRRGRQAGQDRDGRCTTKGQHRPGTPGTPRRSEASGSGTVEYRRHVVTMRKPQPVALQPGGIPRPSSGQTPRGLPGPLSCRAARSGAAARGPHGPRGTNPVREGT